jgi:hypothetical protein
MRFLICASALALVAALPAQAQLVGGSGSVGGAVGVNPPAIGASGGMSGSLNSGPALATARANAAGVAATLETNAERLDREARKRAAAAAATGVAADTSASVAVPGATAPGAGVSAGGSMTGQVPYTGTGVNADANTSSGAAIR